MTWILVKSLLSLAGVLGLMFALAIVVKKIFFNDRLKPDSAIDIEILGSRTIAPKRMVYVLQVLDKVMVVGMTEQGMQTLAELDGPTAKRKTGAPRERAGKELTPPSANFSDYLGKQLNSFVVNRVRRFKKA